MWRGRLRPLRGSLSLGLPDAALPHGASRRPLRGLRHDLLFASFRLKMQQPRPIRVVA